MAELDAPPRANLRRFRLSDEQAYLLPMGAFLAFTWLSGQWPAAMPVLYVLKTFLVATLLALLWRRYTKISWRSIGLGVVFGLIGTVQWIGMEHLMLHYFPHYPRLSHEAFDPNAFFQHEGAKWSFIAIRWAGASLVVPVMEELFWRDFLWRSLLAPNNFELAAIGEWDWKAFALVALIFGAGVHIEWLTAIVWGLLIGLLLVRTKSLGACIIMHGVTNFLLGGYVLWTHEWHFW